MNRWAPAAALGALVFAQQPALAEPGRRLPAEAEAYVERRMGCNHWAGEDAYDADRGRQIAEAVVALRCEALDADEERLRQRYRREPPTLRAIDQARDADG